MISDQEGGGKWESVSWLFHPPSLNDRERSLEIPLYPIDRWLTQTASSLSSPGLALSRAS